MKNKTAKQIVKEYRIKCVLVGVLYAIALAILIFLMRYNMLLSILAIVVLGVSVKAPYDHLKEKNIESVIYNELDPQKFSEILELGVGKKTSKYKMLLYMSSGQHDAILHSVESEDQTVRHPIDKCNNLYRKGYVYFERGEYEKLPEIYNQYKKLKADNPKFAYALNNFSVFEKFDAFSDDDFEYVIDVCDIDLDCIDPRKQNHNLTKINVGFYRAVSLYKLGRYDEAREGFEDIIEFAPKMYKAKLSKDFIDLIDKN